MIGHLVTPGDIRQFFDLRDARHLDRTKARSTPALDITFAVVTLLAVVGLWLDVWSHVTYGADQSIFSEYHLLFYSATVMAGLLLEYTGITNILAGHRWSDALPVGYSLSLAGIIFFALDGCVDLATHAIWGFEAGLEALNSTLIFGLYCLLTMLATRIPIFLPIWLIVGILSDVAMVILKPSPGDIWRFRAFGAIVPLLMWSVYYGFFIISGLGGGIWFTGYIWTGTIVEAGLIGFFLAFLMTSTSSRDSSEVVAMPVRPHAMAAYAGEIEER